MTITAANLVAKVSVSGAAESETEISAMGAATNAANDKLKGLATEGALLAGAALIGFGAASIKMAGDYQTGVTTLVTGAGESAKNIDMVSNAMLAMAPAVGTSTAQLVAGMFQIESSGQHGTKALLTLRDAAEAAKVGNSDLGVTANAITTEMTDYASSNLTAAQASNTLIATVSSGKTTMQELAASLSTILPTASAAGVSLVNVSAAMGTMTGEGVPAAQAATYLRQTIMSLENPTSKASSAMKEFGLSAGTLSTEMKTSLPGTLQMITDAVGKKFPAGSQEYIAAVASIVGGTKSMQGILDLTGSHMQTFRDNVTNIGETVKQGGDSIVGWSKVQGDFNFKIDQATMAVQSLMIGLGTMLLPVLGQIVGAITPVIVSFASWASSTHAVSDVLAFLHNNAQIIIPILAGLGAIVLTLLVPAVWSLAAGVIGATWPFLAIGAAVAGVVAIFMHFYQTSAPFRAIIDDIGKAFAALGPVFLQIGSLLMANLMPAWKQLQTALIPLQPALELIGKILGGVLVVAIGILLGVVVGLAKGIAESVGGIVTIFRGLVTLATGMFNVLGGVIMFFIDLFSGNFGKLGGDLQTIWNGIVQMFSGSWTIIVGIFQTAFGFIHGLISGFIDGVIAFFNSLSNSLVGHSIIPDMINSIITYFTQLPGQALSAVEGLASSLGTFFGNLANEALSWGSHLIGNLISGVENMAGNLASTVSGIASQIANVLGHSTPKEGPLKDDDQWMQHMMDQFSSGINGNIGKIKGATLNVASTISTIGSASSAAGLGGFAGATTQGTMQVVVQAPDIYLDSRLLVHGLMPQIVQTVRTATGVRV